MALSCDYIARTGNCACVDYPDEYEDINCYDCPYLMDDGAYTEEEFI